ncbi:MAG: Asp-tRNA(Asn)/Glu-tRNA(Gln) amidotransferase subunit GatC [Nitrospirae bacterium]|nr:Asp-tRNA(Asn)/Glu-tRNA(Gln) amidotransferase subunit GatC [Nitrospirota bacterium]
MEIEHVAVLSRLELAEDEKRLFSKQINSIIEYIDKLNELDTKNTKPTAHVLSIENVFREDRLSPSLPKDKALQNAQNRTDDFYRVPKIIE